MQCNILPIMSLLETNSTKTLTYLRENGTNLREPTLMSFGDIFYGVFPLKFRRRSFGSFPRKIFCPYFMRMYGSQIIYTHG